MCGIFGFALKKPMSIGKVFPVLQKLEVHQYPNEPRPVGGYGAGIAYLNTKGILVLEKVGAVAGSPAKHLSEIVQADQASVLIGHVRMPSPEFMESAKFRETAQPFQARCSSDLIVVSVDNGKVENYEAIRQSLGKSHRLESESIQLIDSEVIPHFFEDLLGKRRGMNDNAVNGLSSGLEGSVAVCLLQVERGKTFLHLVHKGKTRGLTVWTNEHEEVVFCSRKEPLTDEFRTVIDQRGFREAVSIPYRKDEKLQMSFTLKNCE
jgi:glucosamine 6-phosphate synthetase-like amidotransferase/phosphosugar isomerase protein